MELKKGYKQTEAGVIPIDWEAKKIDQVASVFGGGTPSTEIGSFWGGDINWFTPTEVGYNKYLFESIRKLTKAGLKYSSARILQPGSILLTSRAGIGDLGILKIEAATNQGFQSLITNSNISNEFLYYLMLTKKKELIQNASGSTFLEISPSKVKNIQIQVPPLKEQTAIANVLSDADAYITSLEKLIEKKRQIKQGAMQELLKPKDGWVEKLLTDIVDFTHGKAHEQFIVEDGSYCVVNSKFISTEGRVSKFSNQSFLTARKNDILTVLSDLPNGKALAKCFFVDRDHYYAVNQRICIWRSKNADPKFLFYLLNRHPYFLALNDGVSQTHILNHHIKKCCINIPINKSEQENIGKILSSMYEELKALEEKLEKVKSIKQGMMQQLLTGIIRLT